MYFFNVVDALVFTKSVRFFIIFLLKKCFYAALNGANYTKIEGRF